MPGRTFVSATGYRYGFNGKERDDEIKGSGNSYDYGARLYDPRIGRWLAIDPKVAKYPGINPYNFSLNSPILLNDPNGEDVRITTVQNFDEEGTTGGTITIETTVHLYGSRACEISVAAQEKFNNMNTSYTYVDPHTKKEWTIIIKANFIENQDVANVGKAPQDMKPEDMEKVKGFVPGDNVASTDSPTTSGRENVWEDVPTSFSANGVGGEGIAVHVLGHFIGFPDMYKNGDAEYYCGDITDLCGDSPMYKIHSAHYIAIGQQFVNSSSGDLGTVSRDCFQEDGSDVYNGFNQTPSTGVGNKYFSATEAKGLIKEQRQSRGSSQSAQPATKKQTGPTKEDGSF